MGVVAYELLAGHHPFPDKRSDRALMVAHLIEVPPALDDVRPGLPFALSAVVTSCVAKTPADRLASARELVDALGSLESAPGATMVPNRPAAPSIAVLPFVNPQRRSG